MAIVTTSAFRRAILTWSLPMVATYYMRLFVNDYVPLVSSKAADFQEPSGSWYAPILVSEWGQPFQNASQQAEIDEVLRTWTAADPVVAEQVYGYWVTTPLGQVVWAERAPLGPYPMAAAGQSVVILPRLMVGELC
jgi:hypothetical protein